MMVIFVIFHCFTLVKLGIFDLQSIQEFVSVASQTPPPPLTLFPFALSLLFSPLSLIIKVVVLLIFLY